MGLELELKFKKLIYLGFYFCWFAAFLLMIKVLSWIPRSK